ncbi:hypothetical protein ACTI_60180 [Actinoplanes sp. OR16]|uniref:hypothetical protein n=1 Tax=Actinoplanes sp. OR16 TaxID=946334 RepID=UPI000F6E4F08|nr:hypothetical protein [Actinoplanes sp. OR16]BBH69333.1 hypothetical protein ACTI_60180 [Actinoplanes sp. OR16]
MGSGGWVILEAGGFAAAALAAAAWLFGAQGVELASWFAGVSGVLVLLAAFVLAYGATPPPADPPGGGPRWGPFPPAGPDRPISVPPAPAGGAPR